MSGPRIFFPPCFLFRVAMTAPFISRREEKKNRRRRMSNVFSSPWRELYYVLLHRSSHRSTRVASTVLSSRVCVCVLCLHFENETMRKIAVRHLTKKERKKKKPIQGGPQLFSLHSFLSVSAPPYPESLRSAAPCLLEEQKPLCLSTFSFSIFTFTTPNRRPHKSRRTPLRYFPSSYVFGISTLFIGGPLKKKKKSACIY